MPGKDRIFSLYFRRFLLSRKSCEIFKRYFQNGSMIHGLIDFPGVIFYIHGSIFSGRCRIFYPHFYKE